MRALCWRRTHTARNVQALGTANAHATTLNNYSPSLVTMKLTLKSSNRAGRTNDERQGMILQCPHAMSLACAYATPYLLPTTACRLRKSSTLMYLTKDIRHPRRTRAAIAKEKTGIKRATHAPCKCLDSPFGHSKAQRPCTMRRLLKIKTSP